jgi:hypothetical protein
VAVPVGSDDLQPDRQHHRPLDCPLSAVGPASKMTSHRAPGGIWRCVAVAVAVVSAVIWPLRAPTPAVASINQLAVFGDNATLLSDPRGTLATLRSLGAGVVRVSLRWQTLAPRPESRSRPQRFDASDPAVYPAGKLRPYDEIVRDAQADGITIEFLLNGPAPRWAVGQGGPPGGPYLQWKPSAREYGRFVQAVATRYSGRYEPPGSRSPLPAVRLWEIWNEPNFGEDLAPQAVKGSTVSTSPRMYRALVDAAWGALARTGHGRDTIVVGNLSPRGFKGPPSHRFPQGLPGNFSTTKPLQFVRALYCVDSSYRQLRGGAAAAVGCPTTAAASRRFRARNPGLFDAGGFGIHPYSFNLPPTKADSTDPDYVEFSEIPHLIAVLDRVQRSYGSSMRPMIYNTEFGYITNPPNATTHDGSHFVSPRTAAAYINWTEYVSWRDPRIATTMQYLLYDPSPKAGGFATGLISYNSAVKPTYDAYRLPLYLPHPSATRGRGIEVWGCVRPAHYASLDSGGSQQYVKIQFKRRRGGAFQTLSTAPITNVRGYFDVHIKFPTSGSVRLAWTYPSGQPIFSRTVTVGVRGAAR